MKIQWHWQINNNNQWTQNKKWRNNNISIWSRKVYIKYWTISGIITGINWNTHDMNAAGIPVKQDRCVFYFVWLFFCLSLRLGRSCFNSRDININISITFSSCEMIGIIPSIKMIFPHLFAEIVDWIDFLLSINLIDSLRKPRARTLIKHSSLLTTWCIHSRKIQKKPQWIRKTVTIIIYTSRTSNERMAIWSVGMFVE